MIEMKSAAFSEAPPTSAPSTSGKDFGGVRRRHRAAVEQAHAIAVVAETPRQFAAHERVDLLDLRTGWRAAGADAQTGS